MLTQPRRERLCLPIRQEVNRFVRLQIDQDRAGVVALSPGKIVDAEHLWCGERGQKCATQEAKQRPETDRQSKPSGLSALLLCRQGQRRSRLRFSFDAMFVAHRLEPVLGTVLQRSGEHRPGSCRKTDAP
jgi:hypothetical protein